MHAFNMFIMKKEYLDKYCNWLFDILFESQFSEFLFSIEFQYSEFFFQSNLNFQNPFFQSNLNMLSTELTVNSSFLDGPNCLSPVYCKIPNALFKPIWVSFTSISASIF